MKTEEIRQLFVDYYVKNKHTRVDSSSLIPNNDDTLLFTNAGMVQFKNFFTGVENPPYKNAVSVQKCLRAGGKHNDLDNVGYTARHHTFFEMLGNFSFGEYFKEQAIKYAWELINKEMGINANKLLVTIYHDDNETYDLWKKIANFSDDKIIRISTKDNFWEMGDSGPCGPCSEIFYDYGDSVFGGIPGSKNQDGDRFVEIWNLVFMQYEKTPTGLIDLKKPCIDTGMGLERIASVLSGKTDNYETDFFVNFMNFISNLFHVEITPENKPSFKVIADHIRACGFLIADGIVPSNEGRGYVLRRILRRAIRHSHLLGKKDPILYNLVQHLKNSMAKEYHSLAIKEHFIMDTIYQEELKFCSTFDNGIKILNKEIEKLSNGDILSGATAFKLYETYGFPIDLTEDILKKYNLTFNKEDFHNASENHKDLAKSSWKSDQNNNNKFWLSEISRLNKTQFIGYDNLSCVGNIVAIYEKNITTNEFIKVEKSNGHCFIVLDKTPFYGQMGGQIGDRGSISIKDSFAKIVDTQIKIENLYLHEAIIEDGIFHVGDTVEAVVDNIFRLNVSKNHTAVHLLHHALRKHIGSHVSQQGSFIDDQKLRFDISHSKPLTELELQLVEEDINNSIFNNILVDIKHMDTKKAISMGAMALFSEKYPEVARVVSIGNSQGEMNSIELCAGTHVNSTSQIGLFKIINESSVGSGIRRIEGVCGINAISFFNLQMDQAKKVANLLNTNTLNIFNMAHGLVEENKLLKKEIDKISNKYYLSYLSNKFTRYNNINYVYEDFDNKSIGQLKDIANLLILNKIKTLVFLMSKSQNDNQCVFVLSASNDIDNVSEIFKSIINVSNGSGGGSKQTYQGKANHHDLIELKKSFVSLLK